MNNGANIVYIGSSELQRTAQDTRTTNGYNRTELNRRYAIHKRNRAAALALLRRGYKAPDYANMFLMGPPFETVAETFCFYDCTFSGVLEISEGGNGPLYERVEQPQNVASISSTRIYLQPVYRFFYTILSNAEPRVFGRTLTRPDTVTARDNTTGEKEIYEGDLFFWEPYELQRVNYDKYDEIIEYWRLTYLSS